MEKIKGPAIFLAQFLRDEAPYSDLSDISKWASSLGYKGVQIPTWDKRVLDIDKAAESREYCSEILTILNDNGLKISELASHLQGQVLAMNNSYKTVFSSFYPKDLNDKEIVDWATAQLKKSILASKNLGLTTIPVLSGGFAWHMAYPWPQRPDGLIEEAFKELYNRWKSVLDFADENGVKIAYELHPGSDIFDGTTFERFLEISNGHPAVGINYDPSHFLLQQLDYCHFIELYGDRIFAFHVKDAEFNPTGRNGVYGGYDTWQKRAGRFRSLGDGQIDFKRVFTLLAESGYNSWAVLEWECCIKSPEQGAIEGAPFIANHIIETASASFDDFVRSESNEVINRRILGIDYSI